VNDQAKYVRVGAFVLTGIAAVVLGVLLFGGTGLFADRLTYETYFEESVQGLDVGSPVKLRGVPLGRVAAIGLVADYYSLSDEERARHGQKVVVRIQIALDEADAELRSQYLNDLIESGLRLRIASIGFTGISYIDAEVRDPSRAPSMPIVWTPEYPYIPSVPSNFEQFASAAERIVARLEDLNVERVLTHLDGLLVTLQERASALDVAGAQREIGSLFAELRETNERIQRAIPSDDLQAFGAGAREAMERLDSTLSQLQGMVEGGRYDVGVMLENLRVASDNLRDFSETARSYPSLMLLGEPPERIPVPTP